MQVSGPDDHLENIVEAERGVHVVALGRPAQAQGGAAVKEVVDAFPGTAERLVGNAELLGIPEMDTGLIADLDVDAEV